MKGLKLNIKSLLLICVAVLSMSSAQAQELYKRWDTGSDSTIYREVIMHRIVDQDLIDLIVEYDRMYSKYTSSNGITIYCYNSQEAITYSVSYTFNLFDLGPILLCEPINGQEVNIILMDIYKQVRLPFPRSVELLKNSDPDWYDDALRRQREAEKVEPGGMLVTSVTSDFVEWKITFDKRTGECLSREMPDRTREYERNRRLRERRNR